MLKKYNKMKNLNLKHKNQLNEKNIFKFFNINKC